MRSLVPVVVGGVGAGMLLGADFVRSVALVLFGTGAGLTAQGLILLALLAVARGASLRICRGLGGWLRHLPVRGADHRRAAALAIAVAQTPLLVGLAFLALVARGLGGDLLRVLGSLVVAALAAAVTSVPVARRARVAALALTGGLLAGVEGWPALLAGAALVAAGDVVAGALRGHAPSRPRRRAKRLLEARIAWRALGWKLVGAYAVGLLPLASCLFFLANNEGLSASMRVRAAVLAATASSVVLLARLGSRLAVLRPSWPWARSLPWSASRRVAADAAFLAVHTLPFLAVTMAVLPWSWEAAGGALASLAFLPPLSVRAAGALRRAPERRTGAAGEILWEGLMASVAVTLLPWCAALLLPATPYLVRAAAARERRQKVSRWLSLHHLAAGDPQSWSAS